MSVNILSARARVGLVALMFLFTAAPAQAVDNWEAGKSAFEGTYCSGCHTVTANPPNNANGQDAQSLQNKINSTSGSMRAAAAPVLDPLRTSGAINGTVSDIAAYIRRPNFPTAVLSTSSLNLGTRVAALTTNTDTVRVTNNGDRDLNLTASVSDNTNFSVSPTSCTIPPTGANFCDLTVTFKPQTAQNPFTATLDLTHDALNGQAHVSLIGIGVPPLVLVGPASVQFVSGDGARLLRVRDNLGDRVRVCKGDAGTFSSPTDFSVSGVSLDGSGCAVVNTSGSVPRDIDLSVTFLAALGSGPKNATLTYQRLNSSLVAVGTAITVQLQGNAGPVISFNDTDPFNHGQNDQTEVDGSAFVDRIISVSNTGNGVLSLTSFAISSADPAVASDYTIAATGCRAVATLAAGASCALTIRFDPAALGLRSARLTVTSDGKNLPQPQVIPLNGTGKHGPRLAVAEGVAALSTNAPIDFTSQRLGQTYPARSFTLTNGGTMGDLELNLPASSSVAGFEAVPSTGCTTLPPGASCTLVITFTPTALQHYGGIFQIGSRAAGTADAFTAFGLNLAGDGTDQAPALSWRDPTQPTVVVSAVAFGEVQAGNSLDRHVLVYNDGPGSVLLQVMNLVGVDASNYTLDTSACKLGQFLGERTSCDAILRFAPVTAGAKSVSVQVISNGNGPFVLSVSGTGRAGANAPVLTTAPAALSFSAVVGAESEPRELTLTNSGSLPMTVLSLAVTGPYTVQSKTCQAPPFLLTPAAQCTVVVSFKPMASGSTAGTIEVTTDASATASVTTLSGDGRAAANVSGGGCVAIGGQAVTDPTLWVLVLLATGVLWHRRRTRSMRTRSTAPSRQDESSP